MERDTDLSVIERAGVIVYRYVVTPTLRFDYMSPNAGAIFGVQAEQFLRNPLSGFSTIHPDDRGTLEALIADRSLHPPPVTLRWCHADGRVVWTEHRRFPAFDDLGGVAGYTGFGVDITARMDESAAGDHPLLNANALGALSERLEQMREEERTRISRELHDELGQLLTCIKLDFVATARRLRELKTPGDVVDRLQSAVGQIDLGIAMVRRIATGLRPPGLDHRDLGGAIEYEARRMSAIAGVEMPVTARVTHTVDTEIATAAFRVFEEALTNAVRHAKATRISTTVGTTPRGRLMLYVNDNGVGIPRSRLNRGPSLGLLGMSERARQLGGTLRVTSRSGHGTRVLLGLPVTRDSGSGTRDSKAGIRDSGFGIRG